MNLTKRFIFCLFIYEFALLASSSLLTLHLPKSTLYLLSTLLNLGACSLLLVLNRPLAECDSARKATFKQSLIWGILGSGFLLFSQLIIEQLTISLMQQPVAVSRNSQLLLLEFRHYPITFITICLTGPIMEEIIFRKQLTVFLGQWLPAWLTVLIAASLFAMAHQDGHFIIYFVMSLLLSVLYRKTDSLIAPIMAHSGMNIFILLLS